MSLIVHHLNNSRSQRILWLLEELELPYEIVARRPGDVASSYADPSKANRELGWSTKKTVEDMCVDTWRWQSQNPRGYAE